MGLALMTAPEPGTYRWVFVDLRRAADEGWENQQAVQYNAYDTVLVSRRLRWLDAHLRHFFFVDRTHHWNLLKVKGYTEVTADWQKHYVQAVSVSDEAVEVLATMEEMPDRPWRKKELRPAGMDDEDWRRVVNELIAAGKIVRLGSGRGTTYEVRG